MVFMSLLHEYNINKIKNIINANTLFTTLNNKFEQRYIILLIIKIRYKIN